MSPGWLPTQLVRLVTAETKNTLFDATFALGEFVGITVRVITTPLPDGALVVCTNPSHHVTYHGLIPVNAAWISYGVPSLQFVRFKLVNLAVGRGLTVTVLVPTMSPGWLPTQPVRLVTEVT